MELLVGAERFDEAIQVCEQGMAACPADTFILRGRHAWIEASRKRLSEAIALMRAVLAENRSYVWGWNQLANWELERGALPEAAAALEEMQRLRPHDSWVSRQLGFLRLKQQDAAGARQAFAAAFKIHPGDAAAAHNLLDLQLRNSDLKGAAGTLQLMRLHQPGAATLAAEVFVQLRQQPDTIPRQSLETLCASPDSDPWALNAATDAMERAGQGVDALRIYKKALKHGAANPQLAAAAIGLMTRSGMSARATWFFLHLKPSEQQRRAAAPLVQHLAQSKKGWLLRLLLWRRREVLFRDDAAWGQIGFALSNFNRMKEVARWLSDWRNRSEV